MDTPTPTPSPTSPAERPASGQSRHGTGSWSLRRRRSLAALLVLAFAASIGLATSPGAGAEPKECPNGEPPPCSRPPTTQPPRPPRPPAPPWSANVTVNDLSSGLGFGRTVNVGWRRAGSPIHVTGGGQMAWTDAAQTRGTATIPDPQAQLPAGELRGFYIQEQGFAGPLCRSQPYVTVPASGRNAEIIVGPRVTTTQSNLNTVAAGLVGQMTGMPPDADVRISSAEIEIVGSHLQITVEGHLSYDLQFPIPNVDASFAYVTDVSILESRSVNDVNEMLVVRAAPGILEVTGDGITDSIELMLYGDLEPTFRNATQSAARSAVIDLVNANPLVGPFRAQGFVLSARKVTISAGTGIEVWPSLCRFT